MVKYRRRGMRSMLYKDRLFDALNTVFLISAAAIVLYPLIYILSSSFSAPRSVMAGKVWFFSVDFDLIAYKTVFQNKQVLSGYLNSLIYMVLGTSISVILTMLAAYPLSRKELAGKKVIIALFIFTMLFSGGLIPTYMVVRNLGMVDTRWAVILPNALSVWNMMVMLTFFKMTISEGMYEAAHIEGAGDFRIFLSIILPLSGPIIAVMILYYAVGIWNSYFDALVYLRSSELHPLQIVLRNILVINQSDLSMGTDISVIARRQGMAEVMKYALIVVSSAPLLMIYPFVQKYFVKGVMLGSIKG